MGKTWRWNKNQIGKNKKKGKLCDSNFDDVNKFLSVELKRNENETKLL